MAHYFAKQERSEKINGHDRAILDVKEIIVIYWTTFEIQRFQIPDDLNKEGKKLIGIGAVISAQVKFT